MDSNRPVGAGPPGDELVVEVLRGVPGSADALWNGYAPYLTRVAVALTRSPDEARELVQDTLIAGFRYLRSYDPARSFRSWIHEVLVNQFRRRRRLRWLRRSRFVPFEDNGRLRSSGDVEAELRARQLRDRCLGCLPKTQRIVWALAAIGEMSSGEIAAVLGKRPETVRSHLSKARARIRESVFTGEGSP